MALTPEHTDAVAAAHAAAVATVVATIRGGQGAHAYLLVGPGGVGKTAVARRIAALLMCPAAERPCGTCPHCLQQARGVHPDVAWLQLEVDERSGRRRRQYTLEAVRELMVRLSRTSSSGRQLAVIPEAEALGPGAANALLKTLEEPTPGVVFVLTVRHPQLVPATIASRCQTVHLHPLPAAHLAQHLAAGGIPPGEAQAVARLAGGLPALAWQLVGDPAARQQRHETVQQFLRLWSAPIPQRLVLVSQLAQDAKSADDDQSTATRVDGWLAQWAAVVRDLLLLRLGLRALVRHASELDTLDRAAAGYPPAALAALVEQVQASRGYLAGNANVRLVLENLFLTATLAPAGSPASV